jgi:hypothetical protein
VLVVVVVVAVVMVVVLLCSRCRCTGPPAVDASTSLLSAPKLAARYSSNGHGRRHNDHSATGTFFSLLSSVSSLLFFFRAHFLPALV